MSSFARRPWRTTTTIFAKSSPIPGPGRSERPPRRERNLGDGKEPELLEQGSAFSRRDRVLSRPAVLAGDGFGNIGRPGGLRAGDGSGHGPQSASHTGDVDRDLL